MPLKNRYERGLDVDIGTEQNEVTHLPMAPES